MLRPKQFPAEERCKHLSKCQSRASVPADLPALQEEVERAACSLKKEKSPCIENIPAELLKQGGDRTIKALNAQFQSV